MRWSERALAAVRFLFRPLQDLDVYVEDAGDEPFYTEFFKRVSPDVRIARVFCAGGRAEVIKTERQHDFSSRRALFLIDGDFEWVRGEAAPPLRHLFRLDAYCVENLLIREHTAVQVVIEEAVLREGEARACVSSGWARKISPPLLGLCTSFAVLNKIAPESPTISRGIGTIITAPGKKALPKLDARKVATLRRTIDKEGEAAIGAANFSSLRREVRLRVKSLDTPLDAVSGKSILLPLFEYHLWECTGRKTRRDSLRIRMARHADQARLSSLTEAMKAAAL